MPSRPDNTHYLRAAEQARHAELAQRAFDAIRVLVAAGEAVNFSTVARSAGCSRSFLNRHPELAAEIRRQGPGDGPTQPVKPPKMTDPSARARVEQLRADNTRLRDENTRLRSQVAVLLQQLRSTTDGLPVDPVAPASA